MDQQTLVSLLERIQHNDQIALSTLYDYFAGAVFSVAYRVLQDQQDAEEITQDVFLRIWHQSETFDPNKGKFLNWLLTITRRLAIDTLRKHQRASVFPDPISLDEKVYLWEQYPAANDVSDLQRMLLATLKELPGDYQKAIQLAYFRGMTHKEVANHLGKPLGTIKSHIRQGMEQLRLLWIQDSVQEKSDHSSTTEHHE